MSHVKIRRIKDLYLSSVNTGNSNYSHEQNASKQIKEWQAEMPADNRPRVRVQHQTLVREGKQQLLMI